MNRRPLLYVAGPYTRPDPVANTHRVIRTATVIYAESEWVPLVPHLSLLWHLVAPQPLEFWYEYDLHLIWRCDAIVRLPGDSTGADAEMEYAEDVGVREISYFALPDAARAAWEA